MYDIPSWGWLDISGVFANILSWLTALWRWSGTSGFRCFGQDISWRDLTIAGLTFAIFFHNFLSFVGFEDHYNDALDDAEDQIPSYGWDWDDPF